MNTCYTIQRTPKLTSIEKPIADFLDFPFARWVAAVKCWDRIRRHEIRESGVTKITQSRES